MNLDLGNCGRAIRERMAGLRVQPLAPSGNIDGIASVPEPVAMIDPKREAMLARMAKARAARKPKHG